MSDIGMIPVDVVDLQVLDRRANKARCISWYALSFAKLPTLPFYHPLFGPSLVFLWEALGLSLIVSFPTVGSDHGTNFLKLITLDDGPTLNEIFGFSKSGTHPASNDIP